MKQKIALFHPWLKSKGGAEKVVLDLVKNFDCDIYTWIYDVEKTFEEFKKLDVKIIAPKLAQKLSRKYISKGLFLFVSLFNKIPLENYDKFLISTSGVGEFITFRNCKKGETYAYCHTPLREATDNIIKWNLSNKNLNFFKKHFYLLSVGLYRFLERKAWKKIDHVIFNSDLSRDRAKERNLLGDKKNYVIYPPVDIPKKVKIKDGNYFLYVSRINPPKRQRELINAFNNFSKDYPKMKLILVGTTDNKEYFRKIEKLAGENVELKSDLSNKELNKLYNECKAGIFLGYEEDFGIVPIEVISKGKPLIATNVGGYVDKIKKHPLFFEIDEKHDSKEMANEIEKVLREFMKKRISKVGPKLNMKDFSKEMRKVLG